MLKAPQISSSIKLILSSKLKLENLLIWVKDHYSLRIMWIEAKLFKHSKSFEVFPEYMCLPRRKGEFSQNSLGKDKSDSFYQSPADCEIVLNIMRLFQRSWHLLEVPLSQRRYGTTMSIATQNEFTTNIN